LVSKQIKIIYTKKLPSELELAIRVGYSVANLIKSNYIIDSGIISSIDKDIKTKADLVAHDCINQELSKTGIPVFSEESDHDSFDIDKLQWIIDPIDGTLNFVRGFPMAAISIALWENGVPILGVIHHLFDDQVFYSYSNKGAWLNNDRISVSNIDKKNQAVLATGFPSGRDYSKESLSQFISDIKTYKKMRMLGSAALMLAYVACGYFDAYQENDIYIWDVAAGLSLVSEAGGIYTIESGSSEIKFNVRASRGSLT